MNLVHWRPSQSLLNTWPDFWDDDFFGQNIQAKQLNIYENEQDVVVEANVAGVKSDQIDLTFDQGVLWIRANAKEEKTEEKQQKFSRTSWSYSYKVAVPGRLDPRSEPRAELDNGVLKVSFKKEPVVKAKKLNIVNKNS